MEIHDELKKLLLSMGIEENVVTGINPGWPLMRHVLDSLGYTRFVVGVEERFGIKVLDRYSLRVRSLNDFANLVSTTLAEQNGS